MNRRCLSFLLFLAACGGMSSMASAQATQTLSLNPSKDNTLYESESGNLSNGKGDAIFSGRSGTNAGTARRRAVLAFDLSAISAGSTVTGVSLQLRNSSNRDTGQPTMTLHRLTQDWGEGASSASGPGGGGTSAAAGDATWIHTFFDTSFWDSPGGDYMAAVSAQQTVGSNGTYAWESDELVSDVQAWVDDPASNFGWILIGNESTIGTAKRFNSREASSGQPLLSVTYTPPSQTNPGTIEFTQAVYDAGESDGTAVISVTRTGGTDGEVTVDYVTTDDSATAGTDYTATAGTLGFGDGEGGTKSFPVTMIDDAEDPVFEGIESVRLALTNPTGGAQLGEQRSSELRISDTDDLSHFSYFPQFGNGGGFFSQSILLNAEMDRTATVRIVGHTDEGGPYLLGVGIPGTPEILDTLIEVPAHGLQVFETGPEGDLQLGTVTLSADAPVRGVVVFGGLFGLAGVQATDEFSHGFVGPVDTQLPAVRTGVSIQNLGSDPVSVSLELLDAGGAVVASGTLEIAGLGKVAQFIDEIEWDTVVDFSSFRGSVRVAGESNLSALMIQNRIVEGISQFATLPVVALSEAAAAASP